MFGVRNFTRNTDGTKSDRIAANHQAWEHLYVLQPDSLEHHLWAHGGQFSGWPTKKRYIRVVGAAVLIFYGGTVAQFAHVTNVFVLRFHLLYHCRVMIHLTVKK